MFSTSICRTLLAWAFTARGGQLTAIASLVCGCEVLGADASDEPDQPFTPDSAPSCHPADVDVGGGSATISGTSDGTPFAPVTTALWMGAPDSDASTVVHLFAQPVACGELCAAGWDQRIRSGTQILELKMFGRNLAAYPVVKTPTPAPGEAAASYTVSTSTGTPAEIFATGGTVKLTDLLPGAVASGAFALVFDSNHLDGTFNAVFCPGGHEP